MSAPPVLVPYVELVAERFRRHPVWVCCEGIDEREPWYHETGEDTYRPWTGPRPVDPARASFLVAARFTLADGSVLGGFLTPVHEAAAVLLGGLGAMQPSVFMPTERVVGFWGGAFTRPGKDAARFYAELGKEPGAVFPMRFEGTPGLATGLQSGRIEGFCWTRADGEVVVET
jgi:hypothetical protein